MRFAMIMAGGAGTRLWPLSRSGRPKQLTPMIPRDGRMASLLEIAAERLEGLIPADRRYICTNEGYRSQIRAAMPWVGDGQILGEPVGRDTVNAVGFTAAVLHKMDPDAVFAVLTADHIIEPDDMFRRTLDIGFKLVEQDPMRLVTFAIKPTYPATGFGYVERGGAIAGSDGLGFTVERFVEKPTLERAQAYLESGSFDWNAGMFVWKASTILNCLKRYKPESYKGLMEIAAAWGTPEQDAVLGRVYPELPKISVDYAIMEPASREQARAASTGASDGVRVCTVRMDLRWLDVGSWPSYGETLEPDSSENRVVGRSMLHGCSETVVVNADDSHLIAAVGCRNLIIVRSGDATLIMDAEHAQDLKTLHGMLPDELK
ncbi:MAG: mannose-1-phosphate guanylyltransferase [Phycisphaerales bacterium]